MCSRLLLVMLYLACSVNTCWGQNEFPFENLMMAGKTKECEKETLSALEKDPKNDDMRFALGTVRFFRAIETMGQSFHRYGATRLGAVPFLRLPVPANDRPLEISYKEFKQIFVKLEADLAVADKTLEDIKADDVKLRMSPLKYYLDLNSDGETEKRESLQTLARQFLPRSGDLSPPTICFDKADVHWLRGYCNLLSAMCDFVLAYDQQDMWEVAAHRVFENPVLENEFLREEVDIKKSPFNYEMIIDFIAAIHQSKLKLVDADRMKSAREHMLTTIQQSRTMWVEIQKETDNDAEWIPSSTQKSAVSRVRFTKEMITSWGEFLDESEKILNGELLAIFWRGADKTRGVNIKRFFTEPQDLDVVLWLQGVGAKPYIEHGEVSKPETWTRFQRVFGGNFLGFATWVN